MNNFRKPKIRGRREPAISLQGSRCDLLVVDQRHGWVHEPRGGGDLSDCAIQTASVPRHGVWIVMHVVVASGDRSIGTCGRRPSSGRSCTPTVATQGRASRQLVKGRYSRGAACLSLGSPPKLVLIRAEQWRLMSIGSKHAYNVHAVMNCEPKDAN